MRKVVFVIALIALGLALSGPRAFAHAQLRSANPSEGTRLERAPNAVSLTFTEPPEESLSKVQLLSTSGDPVETGTPKVDPEDDYTLRAPVGELPEGVYTVAWRTVSKVDGHATQGVFAFGVGVDPTEAALPPTNAGTDATSTPTSVISFIGRWMFLAGLVLLLGAASTAVVVLGNWSGGVRRLGELAAGTSAVGLIVLAEGQRRAAEVPLGDFLDTSVGDGIVWRAVALGVAAAGLVFARVATESNVVGPLVVGLGALAGMLIHVHAGHAAADPSWSWAKIGAQWAHFAAAGVWIGGLAALLLGTRGAPSAAKSKAVRRFSTLAGIMLAAVAVTGVFRAVNEVDGWSQLFSTGYGRVILLKVGLLAALATLGAVNRYRSVPSVSQSLTGLRKVSGAELGVAGGALLAAALLATLNPAAPPEATAAQAPTGIVVNSADFATSVRARLEVTPGRAGTNSFKLRLSDYDTGEAVVAQRVSLAFRFVADASIATSNLELARAGRGEYESEGSNLSLNGRWEITAIVERGAESVEIPFDVATPCDARKQSVPGLEPVWVMQLQHGLTAESYVDPASAGDNNVHLTVFDGAHEEIRVGAPQIVATTASKTVEFDVLRLGPGHFVAPGRIAEGEWRFDIGVTVHGQPMQGCFEETIAPAN